MEIAKSNLTLKIESRLLKEVRSVAVRRRCSVDALVTKALQDMISEDAVYEIARRNAGTLLKVGFSLKEAKMTQREAIHVRRIPR